MVGKAAWGNMLRRTQVLFSSSDKLKNNYNNCLKIPNAKRARLGGVSALMDQLTAIPNIKFTLIGHSMGAIVISELLRRYPNIDCDNIVYMGAACPVKDLQDTVLPYLENHPKTDFWNLTLHPFGDRQEDTYLSILPKGSLLDWIDDFASDPHTRRNHTLGKWNNLMRCIPIIFRRTPDAVLKRIHIKGFGYAKGYPQRHGEFDDYEFWNKSYWDPNNTALPKKLPTLK
jgi:pimeloyl-ACP methyl ester carboxylesterase